MERGGKGMSVYDIRQPAEFASDWKVATDSYHRFREDFRSDAGSGHELLPLPDRFGAGVCPEGTANSMKRGSRSTISLSG